MLWVEINLMLGKRFCLKVVKIKARNCIQKLDRDIDIGLRGNYKFLLDKNEKIDAHNKDILEKIQKKSFFWAFI